MTYKIIFFEPYSDSFGGQQRILMNLLNGLDREKFDPVIIVPQEGRFTELLLDQNYSFHLLQPKGILQERGWQNKNKRIDIIKKPFQIFVAIFYLLQYWHQLYYFFIKEQYYAIYCNSFRAVLLICIPARLLNIPIILHEHTAVVKRKNILLWFCFLVSSKVIFVSHDMRNKLVGSANSNIEKYLVIYNGINLPSCIEDYCNNENLSVCFIGKLTPRKNVHILIEAIANVCRDTPVSLFVVGEGEEEYIRKLHQSIELMMIGDRVHFLGHQEDVLPFILKSNLLVLPSENESFGLVILEAYSVKRPVIATKVGGIPEIVIHNKTGLLIPPNNVDALSDALRTLLSQPELLTKMGEEGYRLLTEKFIVQKSIKQIEDVISEVCVN